ncbi:hypothetical protein [Paraburkholderia adhaesiva]|uniref:hypothetical protein n=1 Tax=Paraburkholderia adhaesiva TaxID=2883244 RepID=UPI001F1F5165|nr:hypothetical protein [Paraburkholderia adhaesiva]
MNGRKVCQLLLILAAVAFSGAAMGRGPGGYSGGGFYHGGGSDGWGSFHHGGFHHGHGCCVSFGGVFFGPSFVWGYPWPWYGYPVAGWPVVVGASEQEPVQYVEREPLEPQQSGGGGVPEPGYWYYCAMPEGYYPNVRSCPGGWERVPPRPPGT